MDILSADKNAGAASSATILRFVDELGLLREKDRDLVNSMRSSVSAKAGKFMALSVHGPGPFVPEIIKRRGDPSLALHLYQSDEDCHLDDEKAWHDSNPGLAVGIKSIEYMRAESRRVQATPADQNSISGLRPETSPKQPGS